jgi:hypothetical protein
LIHEGIVEALREDVEAFVHVMWSADEGLLDYLPYELLLNVFTFLEPQDICNAALVCTVFHKLSKGKACYQRLFLPTSSCY